MILASALGTIALGCGDRSKTAQAAADSVRMADSMRVADSVRLADSTRMADSMRAAAAATAARPAAKEHIVKVREQTPGLLAQAKIQPLDAQHLAQTKFPTGTVKDGMIERRGGDLVYAFRIQPKGMKGSEEVLVNAIDGTLITSIHRAPVKKPH
jgi:uncharacterized membrane protein YkoI